MSNTGDVLTIIGAGYGVLQGLGQFLMMFLPKNTVAFKVSKYIVAGPQRGVPPTP